MPTPREQAEEVRDQLKTWLTTHAYPLWRETGMDAVNGGFFEKIDQSGQAVEAPRRARVATRQIYAYAVAGRLGWSGPWREVVEHGLSILTERYLRPDGLFRILVGPDGAVLDDTPAPYEQAFALLALATAHQVLGPERGLEAVAVRTREALKARLGRPDGGFYDGLPHAPPLRANPHMHLFEASLVWMEAGSDAGWREMAEGIGKIALAKMVEPRTGALSELFDDDWRPLPEADVEPGHQFEWGWLLLKFGQLTKRLYAEPVALRLIETAERHGVDHERGVAFNVLNGDLKPRDQSARLWPQTERIKASVAALKATGEERYWAMAAEAARGLLHYLDTPVAGLWRDKMNEDGVLADEPAPASSFYHIVGAILDLDRALS